MSFTCPACMRTSANPHDDEQGYCGRCHAWTRDAALRGEQFAFGLPWNDACQQATTFVAAPIGWDCFRCGEPITATCQGYLNAIATPDPLKVRMGAIHAQCQAVGIIGHQHNVCDCTGYDTTRKTTADELWRRLGYLT